MAYNCVHVSLLLTIHDIPDPINFPLLKKKSLEKSDMLASKFCSSTKCFPTKECE